MKVIVKDEYKDKFKKYEFEVENLNNLFINNEICQATYQSFIDIGIFELVPESKEQNLQFLLKEYFMKDNTIFQSGRNQDQVIQDLIEIIKNHTLKVYDKKTKGNRHLNYVHNVREDLENSFNENKTNIS